MEAEDFTKAKTLALHEAEEIAGRRVSKIKQKAHQRKDIPTRNTSLLSSSNPSLPISELKITQDYSIESPAEVDNLSQISKHLAVRLEDELRNGLEMLCKHEKITLKLFEKRH